MSANPEEPDSQTKPPPPPPDPKKEDSARDLLSEFFYDGICKIVPGLVTLVIFFHREMVKLFGDLPNASIPLAFGILVASWFVGALLEYFPAAPIGALLQFVATTNSNSSVAKFAGDLQIAKDLNNSKESERRHYLKLEGEKIMLRSMIVVSLVAAVHPPSFLGDWPQWSGIAGALALTSCWFFLVSGKVHDRNKSTRLTPESLKEAESRYHMFVYIGSLFGVSAATLVLAKWTSEHPTTVDLPQTDRFGLERVSVYYSSNRSEWIQNTNWMPWGSNRPSKGWIKIEVAPEH